MYDGGLHEDLSRKNMTLEIALVIMRVECHPELSGVFVHCCALLTPTSHRWRSPPLYTRPSGPPLLEEKSCTRES